ncbi:alpha/beta fold hydrolase [Paucilactobacillus kaifaensis]|uniref:alpha/beta fold hydrolase n=1 Tax=Paucilactobacillus kaifaensis TaxID=2559921 RepID=UPI0010F7AE5D|nr:alpha/beta fold hydrolase [Paucilactobacillus kaifaensis]
MKKRTKILLTTFATLLAVLFVGWIYLRTQIYQPSQEAEKIAKQAKDTRTGLYFKSDSAKKSTIIFYPGALVEPASYSIWAKKLANAGYPVYIIKFPMDLAVLSPNKANQIVNKSNRKYIIGGHSLGGVMASRYAKQHPQKITGIFFLASYPDKKGSLKSISMPALSITASRDGVLNQSAYQKAKNLLPRTTKYAQIAGGNHAGFGSYGTQKGDRSATISNQKQQNEVAKQLISWLNKLN